MRGERNACMDGEVLLWQRQEAALEWGLLIAGLGLF